MAKFLDMMMEKLGTVNLWPFVAGLIVLIIVLTSVIQYRQLKKLAGSFNSGAIDDETVKLCQKVKRRNRRRKTAQMHDICCCMLCSMYLERKEEDLFFQNINLIKTELNDVVWRLYLLLAAYLTGQRYLELSAQYREEKTEGMTALDWLLELELSFDEEKLATARARITNTKVIELLDALTE